MESFFLFKCQICKNKMCLGLHLIEAAGECLRMQFSETADIIGVRRKKSSEKIYVSLHSYKTKNDISVLVI